jgi:hypothetical protein
LGLGETIQKVRGNEEALERKRAIELMQEAVWDGI